MTTDPEAVAREHVAWAQAAGLTPTTVLRGGGWEGWQATAADWSDVLMWIRFRYEEMMHKGLPPHRIQPPPPRVGVNQADLERWGGNGRSWKDRQRGTPSTSGRPVARGWGS